jgi:capsular polysaccharide transport system ATP-binding protein
MIILQDVTLAGTTLRRKHKPVLSSVDLAIPSDRRIALLGPSEQDKKKLLNLLCGATLPTHGHVARNARVSFPVGYTGGISGDHSVRLNVAHVARLYGADADSVLNFVQQIEGLGKVFDKKFSALPKSTRRKFAYIIAYSIPFDVYLLESEPQRVPNDCREISYALFQARMRTAGMVISTRDPQFAREFCEVGLVLKQGRLRLYSDIESAIANSKRSKPSRR